MSLQRQSLSISLLGSPAARCPDRQPVGVGNRAPGWRGTFSIPVPPASLARTSPGIPPVLLCIRYMGRSRGCSSLCSSCVGPAALQSAPSPILRALHHGLPSYPAHASAQPWAAPHTPRGGTSTTPVLPNPLLGPCAPSSLGHDAPDMRHIYPGLKRRDQGLENERRVLPCHSAHPRRGAPATPRGGGLVSRRLFHLPDKGRRRSEPCGQSERKRDGTKGHLPGSARNCC